jgi:glycosyltransferase involved in cell wall biosynthesis
MTEPATAAPGRRVLLVHRGLANLPELGAYSAWFAGRGYPCAGIAPTALPRTAHLDDAVLWLFMGIYPRQYRAAFVVHDYRSLSTGHLPHLKDRLKRTMNARPDLRVFLNPAVAAAMGFRDRVPHRFLDMGVPAGLLAFFRTPVPPRHDFVYVGDVSRERGAERMIERFLARYGSRRSLLLVGAWEPAIHARFAGHPNLRFTGRVPQTRVFELVQHAAIALCFVPNRYPYQLQTPTKLLEYAALGKPIIANELASTRAMIERLGLRVRLMPDYDLPPEAELAGLRDNRHLDPATLSWDQAIRVSGLADWFPPRAAPGA